MKKIDEKRKKRRKIRWIVFLSFMLFLVSAAFIVIKAYKVTEVEVTGNELYDDEKITQCVLNDKYSWNSLYVYLKYRFLQTEEVPFIDTMEVALTSRGKLTVTVYEKGLIGYLYIDALEQNAYFDKDGFVIEVSSDIIPGVPRITGLSCETAEVYEKLDLAGSILKTLLSVTQTLSKYDLSVDTIDYDGVGNITLAFGEITVALGNNENLTEKIMRLEKILPQLEGQAGTLHLENWSEETTDITFEKAKE